MPGQTKRQKATFTLNRDLLDEAKFLTREGHFKSLNAFVQEAIQEYIKKSCREALNESLRQASEDPLFLADVAEIERDFDGLDADADRLLE